MWGLVLVVAGILAGLGIYLDLTGPFGRLVRSATGALLGQGKVLVPVILVGVGWVLVRGRAHAEPSRVAIGWMFIGVSSTGLLHLAKGAPAWGSPLERLRQAGGLVGAAVGEPLVAVAATWGATLMLVTIGFLGALIIMRVRVRDAVNRTADGVRPVGSYARRGMSSLFTLPGSRDDDDDDDGDDYNTDRSPRRLRGRSVLSDPDIIDLDEPASLTRAQKRALAGKAQGSAGMEDEDFAEWLAARREGSALELDAGYEELPAVEPKRKRGRKKSGIFDAESLDDWDDDEELEDEELDDDELDDAESELELEDDDLETEFEAGSDVTAEIVVPTFAGAPAWKGEGDKVESRPLPGIDRGTMAPVWKLPSMNLLKKGKKVEVDRRAVESMGRTLEEALAAHGVETRLVGMTVGPTVTRYELELGAGVKVAKVTSLHKDIAYAMATADVRILAPIPGKSAIGVEVPNRQRQLVAVADVLSSPEAKALEAPLTVAIGRDIDGKPVLVDLAKMPHVLVAGTTGSGKSSCINSLLCSILMRTTPDQVRLILIDPKMVELSQYNGLPHLLTQVVTNPKKAANALSWAVEEMERRYELLAQLGFRDVGGYNAAVDRGDFDDPYADDPAGGIGLAPAPEYSKLAAILVVVDELADLMMVAARDVEESICRIAQKARAVGIHLVIATQRPSVNVITGLIKANVPSRFAFAVSSLTDSRVILDQPGAERLIGQGDMLMVTVSSNVAVRVQGNFVSEEEIRKVVGFWKQQNDAVAKQRRTGPEPVLDDPSAEAGAREYTSGFVGFSDIPGAENESPSFAMGGVPAFTLPGANRTAPIGGSSIDFGGSDELVATRAVEDDDDGDGDEMLEAAMELVVRSQLGSTSMLQRKLRVGFSRAGRIMDLLERKGIVGPSVGSKPRDVLMTVEELEALLKKRRA